MKFRYKVIMINIAFLSMALGLLGLVMIYNNFSKTLNTEIEYAITEHNLIQSSIEYNIIYSGEYYNIYSNVEHASLTTYRQLLTRETNIYVYYDDSIQFVSSKDIPSIPARFLSKLSQESKSYYTTKKDDTYYLFVGSKNEYEGKDLSIISVRNETSIYNLLYSQILFLTIIISLVLVFCTVFIFFVCRHLTEPLEKLNKMTDAVATGDYTSIATIDSDDEIGELSEKFNNMTLAISEHVDELNNLIKQRDQFVADFTHEIKTPMTAIIGFADTLRTKELSPENKKIAYQYIYSEGKRLEAMSMKLFDLIYLKSNDLSFAKNDAKVIGNEVSESMIPLLRNKDIELVTSFDSCIINCDKELIKTVFINIIDNAKKASAEHSKILFSGVEEEDLYVFTVEDFGCGMSEETKAHICDEFYMADKSRSRAEGGAGLGMSLSSLIVKRHDGSLSILSEPGKGTKMKISLSKVES